MFTGVSLYLDISGHPICDIPVCVWLILLIIGLLLASFFAWRTLYKAKLEIEKELDELKSKNAVLERRKKELEIEKLESEAPIIGRNGWPGLV